MGNLTSVEVRLPKYTIVAINTSCECEKLEPSNKSGEAVDNNIGQSSYRSERETRNRTREIALKRKTNCKTCVGSLRPRLPKQILVIRQERLIRIINNRLNKTQIETIEKLINEEYGDLFAKPNEPTQSQVINVEHEIDTGDARPVNKAPYRASPAEREIIRIQVAELKNKGIIQLSKSPWAAGIVLVKKKDGSVRFCLDYRSLNAVTKRDVYPLPRIDDSLAALRTGVFFSTMDMQAGYYQVPMAKASMEKTAFITEDGLYEFRAMPFGLTNAPATFQRFMDATCAGLKWQCLLVYLDDLVVFSTSFEQHLIDLRAVFDRLRQANIQLKPSKCHFAQNKLKYLGHVVSDKGIEADPDKVKAIVEMPEPKDVGELRTFLGMCSYYRKFIDHFSDRSHPLFKLTHLNETYKWEAYERSVFEMLKKCFVNAPILWHPNFDHAFAVQTDASDVGLGAVLVQYIDGQERATVYLSRTLQPAEKNWATREKEALAILWACETLRPYLIGRKFHVETDHDSLVWLMTAKSPARFVRWACRLAEFDFIIRYRPGRFNQKSDALSRLPVPNEEEIESSETMPDRMFASTVATVPKPSVKKSLASSYKINGFSDDSIREAQRNDINLLIHINKCLANGARN
jgi:hypothetical protein